MLKKGLPECLYVTILVFPDPLSPTPSSAMKTLENTKEDSGDPEPADEGSIQMEYFPD
jgi:hypothetical protein